MKINRKIAAGIDPRVRQLADQMMGYMADRQALLNSGTDVGLPLISVPKVPVERSVISRGILVDGLITY
jgi:hypothetical protein